MNIKTLILARGGSKGIPDKNIIDVNGKPLLSYTTVAAQNSIANDVWISTNCNKIMNIAEKYNANIIVRPDHLCTDISSSDDALLHFAHEVSFDILVFIQPTSPLLLSEDINKGLELINNCDSVFTAYKEHWIPRWNNDITPHNWNHLSSRPRRQDMPEYYVENGAMYITTRDMLLSSQHRYGGKISILEMPYSRSFQVDTYDDLEIIKKLLNNQI